MNVITQTYDLTDGVTVQLTMRSTRVLTADEVRAFSVLAEAAEKLALDTPATTVSETP